MLFDRLVTLAKRIVFGVRNARRILLVVKPVVLANLAFQPCMFELGFFFAQILDGLGRAARALFHRAAPAISLSAAARASSVTSAPANMRAISSRFCFGSSARIRVMTRLGPVSSLL